MAEDSTKVDALNRVAYTYWEDAPAKSLIYINQAIALGIDLGYNEGVGLAYNLKAGIYRTYGNTAKALEELLLAEDYLKHSTNKWQLSNVISNIGATYYDIGEDSIAIVYANKALALKKVLKDTSGYCTSLLGKAISLQQLGDSTQALALYEEAKVLLQQKNDSRTLFFLYSNLASYYFSQQAYVEALAYCYKCRDIARNQEMKRQQFDAAACIVRNLLQLKRLDTIPTHLKLMQALIPVLGDYPSALNLAKLTTSYFEEQNQLDSALFYQKQVSAYTDSLYQQEREKENRRFEMIQQFKQKEQEAKQLTEASTQQQYIIRLQYFIGGLILSVLIIIMVLWVRQYQFNKKLNQAYTLVQDQKKDLDTQKQALEKLNTSKTKLFSIISHDLITPLSTLTSILQLQKEGVISEEELPNFLDEAMIEVGNTTVFLRNLLLWAKSQIDGLQVQQKNVDMASLIYQNVELLQPQARKKAIELTTFITEPSIVVGDEDLLSVVLRNLLANAIKFTPQGGKIQLKTIINDHKLRIEVIDHGIGMDQATQKRIFSEELFSTYGTDNEKGTGLGLQLCQDFLQKNNSELQLESELGKGTRFYFELALSED